AGDLALRRVAFCHVNDGREVVSIQLKRLAKRLQAPVLVCRILRLAIPGFGAVVAFGGVLSYGMHFQSVYGRDYGNRILKLQLTWFFAVRANDQCIHRMWSFNWCYHNASSKIRSLHAYGLHDGGVVCKPMKV